MILITELSPASSLKKIQSTDLCLLIGGLKLSIFSYHWKAVLILVILMFCRGSVLLFIHSSSRFFLYSSVYLHFCVWDSFKCLSAEFPGRSLFLLQLGRTTLLYIVIKVGRYFLSGFEIHHLPHLLTFRASVESHAGILMGSYSQKSWYHAQPSGEFCYWKTDFFL